MPCLTYTVIKNSEKLLLKHVYNIKRASNVGVNDMSYHVIHGPTVKLLYKRRNK